MSTSLQCTLCGHDEFVAIEDHNDTRKVKCQGCDGTLTLDELTQKHGVSEVCVMTPHTVTDTDTVNDALTGEVGDEVTRQGYHRKVAYITCHCGEMFTGEGHAQHDFKDHLTEVQEEALNEIEQ